MYPGFSTSDMHNDFSALTLFPNRCEIDTQKFNKCASIFSWKHDGPAYGIFNGGPIQVSPVVYPNRPAGMQGNEPSKCRVFSTYAREIFWEKVRGYRPTRRNRAKEWMKVQRGFAPSWLMILEYAKNRGARAVHHKRYPFIFRFRNGRIFYLGKEYLSTREPAMERHYVVERRTAESMTVTECFQGDYFHIWVLLVEIFRNKDWYIPVATS